MLVQITRPYQIFDLQADRVKEVQIADFKGMLGLLRSIPIFKKDMDVLDELDRKGSLQISIYRDAQETYIHAARRPGWRFTINIELSPKQPLTPADLLYLLAHEIVHVADHARLAALLARRSQVLPHDLFSRNKDDLAFPARALELPNGFFADQDLWAYMTEQRAYYVMNRLYNALSRNRFKAIQFQGDEHLRLSVPTKAIYDKLENPFQLTAADSKNFEKSFPGVNKKTIEEVLLNRGFSAAQIDRLRLPEHITPVTAFILGAYLSDDPAQELYAGNPSLPRFMGLSVKEILSGKIRPN